MGAAVVQVVKAINITNNTAIGVAPASTTIGNTLVVIVTSNKAQTSSSISDNGLNTYEQDLFSVGPVAASSIAAYSAEVTASTNNVQCVFGTTANAKTLMVIEVSGLDPSTWLQIVSAVFQGTASTARTMPTETPTNAGDLVVAGALDISSSTGWTAGSGYTALGEANTTSTTFGAIYQVAAGGATTPTATRGASIKYASFTIVYSSVFAPPPATATPQPRVVGQAVMRAATRCAMVRREWRRTRSGILIPELGFA